MSESAASYHPTSGAEEFDRRMRSLGQAPSDALAELARLVGHHDPFGEDSQAPVGDAAAVTTTQPVAVAGDEHEFAAMDFEPSYPESTHLGEEPGAPSEPAIVHPLRAEPAAWERAVPRFPSISPRDEHAIEPSPDIWAQGSEDHHGNGNGSAPALEASREAPASVEPSSAKRTLVVLVAVVALTGGGLAASFLARPSNPSASAATTAPTIMAATGPSKVQPETPTATGDDAPSEPSKLLDKNGNDGTATAKVVNNVEQPVDLAQAIKPSTPDPSTDAAPASPFPQPRKVKTISVRPDGSVIADAAPPAVPATSEASLAFDPQTALPPVNRDPAPVTPPPVVMPVAAEPTVPTDAAPAPTKATTRITSPKPAASTAQEGTAVAQSRSPVATPKAKLKPKPKPVAAAPAPVEEAAPVVAEAAPAAGDVAPALESDAGGKFAIQLGAAPSEAEGRAAATRLGQKFAGDLGGASPSVHKAQAGGKTVYRIRVGNLSQEGAKALCAKVQAAGGGCFVARN